MPPSDNDTSDDETQEEFTTTNVLLGYASKEPTDDSFSQLGGYPVRSDPRETQEILISQGIYRGGLNPRNRHRRIWQDAKCVTV
jgi:hypothetical protein